MFQEKPERGYSDAFENLAAEAAIKYITPERDFLYEEYFTADTETKLAIILSAEEHILSLEHGKKRIIYVVTDLSIAFAIVVSHDKTLDSKDVIGIFLHVNVRLSC